MRVEGKRPTMHDLESIGGVLYNAEWRVHEMAGIQKELQPAPPFYSDEWPEELVKVLGLSTMRDTGSLLRRFLWLSPPAASRRPGAPAFNFTRNNTSNTRRRATNAGSRTARRHGEARNLDARNTGACNTDGHEHARISANDAFVSYSHGRQRAS